MSTDDKLPTEDELVEELEKRAVELREMAMGAANDQGAGLFGLSDEAKARMDELVRKHKALEVWGLFKLDKAYAETIKEVERLIAEYKVTGKIDEAQIVPLTTDIVKLEKLANEYDKAQGVDRPIAPIRTPFDIEQATPELKGAKAVADVASDLANAANNAANAARDAGKDLTSSTGFYVVAGLLGLVGLGYAAHQYTQHRRMAVAEKSLGLAEKKLAALQNVEAPASEFQQ